MSEVTFKRITPEESRIYDSGGDHIGDVYRQDDILNPGGHYYVILLDEDWRGPVRVHQRSRIREVAAQRLSSHPFYR